MSTLSTHVLDTSVGKPAAEVRVILEDANGGVLGSSVTNADGRAKDLAPSLAPGTYRLRFAIDEYFLKTGREAFYPEVVVLFRVSGGNDHYHVPLLVSPFGYSTYRGS